MNYRNIVAPVLALLFLAALGLLLSGVMSDKHSPIENIGDVRTLSRFQAEFQGKSVELNLPHSLRDLPPRTPVTLHAELHDNLSKSLYVKSVYAPLRIYADDVLIYESGQEGSFQPFLVDPPTMVGMVGLPQNKDVVKLRLEYLSPRQRDILTLHPLLVGNEISLLELLLHKFGFSLLFALVLASTGLVLVGISLFFVRSEPSIISFFWLGMFALAVGIWVLGESNFSAFFIPYPALLYVMAFTGLFTLSIPIAHMGLSLPGIQLKLPMQIASIVLVLCASGAFILQWAGLVALNRSMYLFHILTPGTLGLFSVCMLWEWFYHKNTAALRLLLPTAVLTLFAVLEVINYQIRITDKMTFFFQIGALFFVLILSSMGGIYLRDSYRTRADKIRLESELGLLGRYVEMQKSHYAELTEKIDAAIRYRHDERHHMQSLYNIWESKNYDRLGEYLESYVMAPMQQERIVLCRHLVIDAILQFYGKLCQERGIEFTCQASIPAEVSLSDAELSVLWGNLLENALEAASAKGVSQPFLTVLAFCEDDILFLRIANSFSTPPRKKGSGFLSLKHEGRGVGTESVKAVVAAHNGQVQFKVTDQIFQVSLMVHLQHVPGSESSHKEAHH